MAEPPTPSNDHPAKPPVSASRRRDKPQLSCTMCRRRKLRCDRAQPCDTCVRRGVALSCVYVHSNAPHRVPPAVDLPDRISQLESLVTSLMNRTNKPPEKQITPESVSEETPRPTQLDARPTVDPVPEKKTELYSQSGIPLADNFGRISLEKSETTYVESTHWTAILDEIAELKDFVRDNRDRNDQQGYTPAMLEREEPEIIFGQCQPITKQEILAAVPPRHIVDRLVSGFFFSYESMAPIVVHSLTFLKEYEHFWEHPIDTPLPWIALLYSIMCLSVSLQNLKEANTSSSETKKHRDEYREKIIQCLVLSKYTKCAPYTLETLVLYLNIEYFRIDDSHIEPWILLGVIIRLALRMGYHRDPSHFPHITPFQGEMRRRIWALIVQFDILSSSQIGLPRMVTRHDTAEPGNLLDEDFHKDITAIPIPRPHSFHTPVLYMVSKNRLLAVYGMICDLVTLPKLGVSSYPEVMQLDSQLSETYAAIPAGLKERPLMESIMDPPNTIIRRIYVAIVYHKAKCILHYKYLLPARMSDRYEFSRSACIEAALKLLEYQSALYQESKPGGRLSKDGWKVTSIVNTSFFLASTLLSLELDYDISAVEQSPDRQSAGTGSDRRRQILDALNGSYLIWIELSDSSKEARKAADVLGFVLRKMQRMEAEQSAYSDANSNGVSDARGGSRKIVGSGTTIHARHIQSPASMYGTDAMNIDSQNTPTSIPQLLRLNAGAHIDYSDITIESFSFTQSLDDFLEMSPNYPPPF